MLTECTKHQNSFRCHKSEINWKILPELDVIKVSKFVSDHLFELIVSWIDQTYQDRNQDWNEEESLKMQVSVIQNVGDVDVNNEGKHVETMESYTNDVMIVGISVPFKLNKLLNSLSFIDVELI